MLELIFIVEESPEGGYTPPALGAPIFTEADDWAGLQANVRDAVSCHFDEEKVPVLSTSSTCATPTQCRSTITNPAV